MIKPIALLIVLIAWTLHDVHAVGLSEADGVRLLQTTQVVDAETIENTSTGRLVVDINKLRAVTGPGPGYINMTTSRGWVVRNLPVLAEEGYPYSQISAPFDLGVVDGTRVTSIDAAIDFSPIVLRSHAGPLFGHSVGGVVTVIGGAGESPVTGRPSSPDASNIFFEGTGDDVVTAIDLPILDAAKNQSFPMSFANNLQFLKNTKGLQIAFEHKPGLRPSVSAGDDSLVGRIEESIGRTVTDRRNGEGAFGLQGKLRFMAEYGLSSQLSFTHFGSFGPDSGASSVSATVNGVTATSSGGGTSINFDTLFASVREGQACTLVLQWPTGAHASSVLAAGRTHGQPWIIHGSDTNTNSDELGAGPSGIEFAYLSDTNGNGRLNLNGSNSEVAQMICDRYVPPPSTLFVLNTIDPSGHSCCVGPMPPLMQVTRNLLFFSGLYLYSFYAYGNASWLPMSGTQNSDGTFSASSIKTVAGFPNVKSDFTGTCSSGTCEGRVSVGTRGELPGGQPISWDVRIAEPEQPLRPAVRVNGFRGRVDARAGDPLRISISMLPAHKTGTPGDWWLAAQAPDSSFHYFDLGAFDWRPGLAPTYTGPLFDLPHFSLPTLFGVLPGDYSYFFGFDSTPNGVLDGDLTYEHTRVRVLQ